MYSGKTYVVNKFNKHCFLVAHSDRIDIEIVNESEPALHVTSVNSPTVQLHEQAQLVMPPEPVTPSLPFSVRFIDLFCFHQLFFLLFFENSTFIAYVTCCIDFAPLLHLPFQLCQLRVLLLAVNSLAPSTRRQLLQYTFKIHKRSIELYSISSKRICVSF